MTFERPLRFLIALTLAYAAAPAAATTVLATNGEVSVTTDDFEAEMLRIPKAQRFEFRASAQRLAKMVESILITKTLAAAARKNGTDRDPLARKEIELNADKVLARWERERREEAIQVPDLSRRAREIYLANPDKYSIPASYHTSHILIDTKCRSRDAAFARAAEARREILAGMDFAAAVARFSDDPTAPRNKGDLGFLAADQLAAEFAQAAAGLKPGELSEPVQTQFGVHIIRMVEARPRQPRRFEDMKGAIVDELRQEYVRLKSDEIMNAIRADPAIKVNSQAIDALKTQVGPPADATKPR